MTVSEVTDRGDFSGTVGYRETPYRLGRISNTATLAELTRKDKDRFVERWVAVTEPSRPAYGGDGEPVRSALHSSDRTDGCTR